MLILIAFSLFAVSLGAAYVVWVRKFPQYVPWLKKANTAEYDPKIKERDKRADNRRLGYRYVEDVGTFFFIRDSGVWTGVRLASVTDEFSSTSEQESDAERAQGIQNALLDYFNAKNGKREAVVPCHEIIRNQPVDTSEWLERYHSNQWDPSALFDTLVDDGVEPHIRGGSPVRARYLLVRIGDQKQPVSVDPAALIVDADDSLCNEIFAKEELDFFRGRANDIVNLLSAYGTPMDRADLAWLIRKPLAGTFPVRTDIEYNRTRYARNVFFDELVQFDGFNMKQQAAVQIANPDIADDESPQVCYSTTLTVETSDTVIPFRYWDAWGRLLRSLPNPPEISWRYQLIADKLWSKAVVKATRKIADEVKDRTKDGNERALDDTRFGLLAAEADEVKEEMEAEPRPGMFGQLRISLTANSLRELKSQEQTVTNLMKNFVKLTRLKNCQYALLEEQLPGDVNPHHVGRSVLAKDFGPGGGIDIGSRYSDMEILSLARLDSAPTVGDDIEVTKTGDTLGWHGHVIGYAAENGAIVHFDPVVQMSRNAGSGVAIIGASGGGKSTLALCLFFWASEAGSQCVVLDPKNDFEKFCLYLAFGKQVLDDEFEAAANAGTIGKPGSKFQPINREFWNDTRIVSLTYGDNGSLESWKLTDDYEEGERLARRQVELLFADLPTDSPLRTVLDLAFNRLRKSYKDRADLDPNTPLPSLSSLESHLLEDYEFYEDVLAQGGHEKIAARQNRDAVDSLRKRLERARHTPYARLLFSDPEEHSGLEMAKGVGGTPTAGPTKPTTGAIRGFNHRRTIVTMVGFKPPANPTEAKATDENRAASAAMFTVLWQVERVFSSASPAIRPNRRFTASRTTSGIAAKNVRPRLLFVDEAYMVTAFEEGANLLKRALRQGRSFFFGVVIISQQALDINAIEKADDGGNGEEADQNQFGSVFVFMQRGDTEARAALKLLRSGSGGDSAAEEVLAKKLRGRSVPGGGLETGVCVTRDLDNRVATVIVDPIFDELHRATQTNAALRGRDQSVDPRPIGEWLVRTDIRDVLRKDIIEDRLATATDDFVEQFDYAPEEFAAV